MSSVFKRVLMCPPTYFKVEYKINPWMGGVVDRPKAQAQWDKLKSEIENAGVQVQTLTPVDGLPDMVFCCNSGISYGNKGEETHYRTWFQNNNIEMHGGKEFFEGGGDAVFSSKDTLWAGYGYRTAKEVYEQISSLGSFRTVLCELINPNFYHLDTCFCPLNERQALYYPAAFSAATAEEMAKHIELIPVSKTEAEKFACNAIAVGEKTVIFPGGCPEAMKTVESKGYKAVECDMSEFMKSGGACQCLVMKLM